MRRLFWAGIFVLGLSLVAANPVSAQDEASTVTPMQVTLQQEPAGFDDPFYCAFITAGENKFTFLVPQGFRLKNDPATGRVVLESREGDSSIAFTILSPTPVEANSISAEAGRALVLRRHPGARITQEFSAGVGGRAGPAFDLQWKVVDNIYQCERVSVVPTVYGTFMFSVTCSRRSFPAAQGNLGLVMGSFRGNSEGKFMPVHIAAVN